MPVRPVLPPAEFPRLPVWLCALIVTCAIGLVYARTLEAPFVLDDHSTIRNNVSLRHLWPFEAPSIGGARGRPVVNFSLAVNYALSGAPVAGYHVGNIIIHAATALLLFGLIRRTLRLPIFGDRFFGSTDLLALFSALLWAVHPLQTEAVTYLSQRTESLMGLHYLAVLYFFVRSTLPGENARVWKILAVVACFLGMACKEVMVTAPVIALLFDRTFLAGSFVEAWRARRRFYLALASSWLALAGLMLGLDKRGAGFAAGVSPLFYALTESRVVLLYLKLSVWPHPLVFDYGSQVVTSLREVWPYALGLGAGLLAVAWIWWERPQLGFLVAWPFLTLSPTSSVVPIALQPMAEHRMYLPLVGLVTLAAVGLHRLLGRKFGLVIIPAALSLAGLSYQRNAVYRDEIALWHDTVEKCPDNDRAQLNLGLAYLNAGRAREAQESLERSLAIDPRNFQALNNLGVLHARAGHNIEALDCFKRSLQLNAAFDEAHYNAGCILLGQGNTTEAQRHFEAVLALNPDHASAHNNLATILAGTRNYAGAIAHYSRALHLNPRDSGVFCNRAYAYCQLGHVSAAIADYEQALKLRPDLEDARRNLDLLRGAARGSPPP